MAEADSTSCTHCGAPIEQPVGGGRTRKFCSDRCRWNAQKTGKYRKKQPVFRCKTCGVLFLRLPGKGYGYCCEACHPDKCTYKPTIAFCDGCGSLFVSKRDGQRYCNRKCQGRARASCIACGAEYYATRNSLGKYCSITCSLERTHAERRSTRHQRRREKEDAWRERNQGKTCRVSIKPCICCERELVGPKPTKAWAANFCGSCRDALGNAIGSHAGRVEFLKARLIGRECEVCGSVFIPFQETTPICSKVCERKTEKYKEARRAYTQTETGKRAKRIQNRTRRARKYGNGPVDQIDPIEILERDGWRCYLCGVYTPKKLRGHLTDPRAPVMDHVIPLAAGGTHTLDNVACCCAKCNTEKGHMIYQKDLFIQRLAAEPGP